MVHYNSERSRADAKETAQLVEAQGARATLVAGDLTQTGTPKRLFDQTFDTFGRMDILINNAGMIIKKPIGDITEEDFDTISALNAKAPFLCMQEAARRMSDNRRIVNIGTSLLGMSIPFYGIYASSKASLEHFSRDLALQLRDRGITVNTVAPGSLDTPFFYAAETPESVAFVKQVTGGLGRVADVVPLAEFLVSSGRALADRPDTVRQWKPAHAMMRTIFIDGGTVAC